jgi:S1-C subfamily serine protease
MIAMTKSNISAISPVVTALFVLVLTALSLLTFQTQSMAQTNSISSTAASVSGAQSSSPNSLLSLKAIFKQVQNSIVQITSKAPIPTSDPSNPQAQNATALGSGFVYDKQGHIVTNNHVVGNTKIVDVSFVDGNRYTAKVTGTDIYSDIAVIQIQNITQPQQQSLLSKPLVIGNSSKLEVGDPVIAIGNPFGLTDTLTTGIVSGVGRLLPSEGAAGFSIPNAIQTDAPINPGNSGGPLLNMQGQVVGINTAILSDTGNGFSGLGFAVPSNAITKIVPTLIQKGTYPHPYLGVKLATLTSDILQNVTGLPPAAIAKNNLKGAYVDTITKNGPADKAGIHGSITDQYSKKHTGDIITAVDRHPIVRSDDLISYIEQHKSVGDSVTLTVYRNSHTVDLKTILTARPSPLPFLPTQSAPSPLPSPPPPPAKPPTIPRLPYP